MPACHFNTLVWCLSSELLLDCDDVAMALIKNVAKALEVITFVGSDSKENGKDMIFPF